MQVGNTANKDQILLTPVSISKNVNHYILKHFMNNFWIGLHLNNLDSWLIYHNFVFNKGLIDMKILVELKEVMEVLFNQDFFAHRSNRHFY